MPNIRVGCLRIPVTWDGVADDTLAVQAAFDAGTVNVVLGTPSGPEVILPAGCGAVSSLKVRGGLRVRCDGYSNLMAYKQTVAKPVIDATMCNLVDIRGLTIFCNDMGGVSPAVPPTVGILFAGSATGSPNVNILDSVTIGGYAQYASFYVNGCTNSSVRFCRFGNLYPTGYAAALSISNVLGCPGVTSRLVTTNEIVFSDTEFHSRWIDTAGNRPTIIHDGTNAIGYNNCLFSQDSGIWEVIQFYGHASRGTTIIGGKAYHEFASGGFTYFAQSDGLPTNGLTISGLQIETGSGYAGVLGGTGTFSFPNSSIRTV